MSYGREFWDNRYASAPGYVFGTAPNDFLEACVHHVPPGPVLCLAEGEGRNAVFLAGQGHDVTAVDQSAAGLAKAKRLAAERGVTLSTVQADLDAFVIEPGAWSGVVVIFAHLPPPLRRALNTRIVAGLAPGGIYLSEVYSPAQLAHATGGPRERELLVTAADLRAELAGLDFLIARECERDVVEGTGHTGLAAVTQVLARRPE